MTTHKVLMLPGDGIGPEVCQEVSTLIDWMNKSGVVSGNTFEVENDLVGGASYDAHQVSVTDETMGRAMAADAILFGAVGGPKWDDVAYEPKNSFVQLRSQPNLTHAPKAPSSLGYQFQYHPY